MFNVEGYITDWEKLGNRFISMAVKTNEGSSFRFDIDADKVTHVTKGNFVAVKGDVEMYQGHVLLLPKQVWKLWDTH